MMAVVAVVLVALALPRAASAQFVAGGAGLEAVAEEKAGATDVRGRLSASSTYYAESADDVTGESASPFALLFSDLRARLSATRLGRVRWGATLDARVRVASDDRAARGAVGGSETDLGEAFVMRRSGKTDVVFGRQLVREADAITVDGVRVEWQAGGTTRGGLFLGASPNPYSRSLGNDYATSDEELRGITDLPIAAGAYAAYRTTRAHGSVAAAALHPRDADPADDDPLRAFAAAQGYLRVRDGLDLHHYAVVEAAGELAGEVSLLQAGFTWRPRSAWLVEAGVSRQSTRAIALYLRELLERPESELLPGAPPPGAPLKANLTLARVGTDEARARATWSTLDRRGHVYAEARVRSRDALDDPLLPPELAVLPADRQLDLTAGVRRRQALRGFSLAANVVSIRGDRADSLHLSARAHRSLLHDRLELEFELARVAWEDLCDPAAMDPTCTGTSTGTTLRAGAFAIYQQSRRLWFLADVRLATTSGEAGGVTRPDVASRALFARAQYSF